MFSASIIITNIYKNFKENMKKCIQALGFFEKN